MMSNVVRVSTVSRKLSKAGAVSVVIPVDEIERTRKALDHLEVCAQLCQRILDKRDKYGDEATLAGVRQVLQSVSCILATALSVAVIF